MEKKKINQCHCEETGELSLLMICNSWSLADTNWYDSWQDAPAAPAFKQHQHFYVL
jgi:hypothetical protein